MIELGSKVVFPRTRMEKEKKKGEGIFFAPVGLVNRCLGESGGLLGGVCEVGKK